MGAVKFNNIPVSTGPAGGGNSNTTTWVDMVYGNDFNLNSLHSNYIDTVAVNSSKYWKKDDTLIIISFNIDVHTNSNVPSNTNTISFDLINNNLVSSSNKFINYCLYSRTLKSSEQLNNNDHPMLEITKSGVIFKKPLLNETDQDGSVFIQGAINPRLLSFKTDGIGINHIYNFSGQLSYSS